MSLGKKKLSSSTSSTSSSSPSAAEPKPTKKVSKDLEVHGGLRRCKLDDWVLEVSLLVTLDLSQNRLTELPEELGRCRSLRKLHAEANSLVELPPAIGELRALEKLYVQFNKLRHVAPEIGQCVALEQLDVSNNPDLHVLPCSLGSCFALKKLRAYSCPMVDPPAYVLVQPLHTIMNYFKAAEDDTRSTSLAKDLVHPRDYLLVHVPRDRFALFKPPPKDKNDKEKNAQSAAVLATSVGDKAPASPVPRGVYSSPSSSLLSLSRPRLSSSIGVADGGTLQLSGSQPSIPPRSTKVSRDNKPVNPALARAGGGGGGGGDDGGGSGTPMLHSSSSPTLSTDAALKHQAVRDAAAPHQYQARVVGVKSPPLLGKLPTTEVTSKHRLTSDEPLRLYLQHSTSRDKGPRPYDEDRYFTALTLPPLDDLADDADHLAFCASVSMFGIYDGHAGAKCSEWLAQNMHIYVMRAAAKVGYDSLGDILKHAFVEANRYWISLAKRGGNTDFANSRESTNRGDWLDDGSTCSVVLVRDNVLCSAWVGDSRAVLCRNLQAVDLVIDHRCDREDEQARVRALGGTVYVKNNQGPMRVNGEIAMTRSIGDIKYKTFGESGAVELLVAEPEIMETILTPEDSFLIVASDGLWDKLSSKDAVTCTKCCTTARQASKDLLKMAMDLPVDNMCITVAMFRWTTDRAAGPILQKQLPDDLAALIVRAHEKQQAQEQQPEQQQQTLWKSDEASAAAAPSLQIGGRRPTNTSTDSSGGAADASAAVAAVAIADDQ